MSLRVNYVVDPKGHKVFVQIPAKEWEKMLQEMEHLRTLLNFKQEIKAAMQEVREIQQGKKKGTSLKEFLDEVKNYTD